MKKKSIVARVGIVAAALTLATTSMMSGTLAKYTTEAKTTATAVLAKWNPTIKDKATGGTEISTTTPISLADSKYLRSGDVDAAIVKSTSGEQRIAPSMTGEVPVTIFANDTEMDIKYEIYVSNPMNGDNLTYSNPTNLKFKVGSTEVSIPTNGNPVKVAEGYVPGAYSRANASGGSAPNMVSTSIIWEWKYANPSDTTYDSTDNSEIAQFMADSTLDMGFDLEVKLVQATGVGDDKWKPTT